LRTGTWLHPAGWFAIAVLAATSPAPAELVIFDDRDEWAAAVGGASIVNETFLGPPVDQDPAEANLATGLTIAPAMGADFVDLAQLGRILVANPGTLQFTFANSEVTAFGFEFTDVDIQGADIVSFGTFQMALPVTGQTSINSIHFFGVVADEPGEIGGGFTFQNSEFVVLDNLSTFVPEPAGWLLSACGLLALLSMWRKRVARPV